MLNIFRAVVFYTQDALPTAARGIFFTLLHVSAKYFCHHQGNTIFQRHKKRIVIASVSRQIFPDLPICNMLLMFL